MDFVEALEEVMIRTASYWEIPAKRNPMNRGVWVGHHKLGSIGIAIRRGISFHGFALNVNTSLEPFSWIHPCGLKGIQVTSMKEVTGGEIPMEDVRRATARYIQEILGVELRKVSLEEIYRLLGIKPLGIAPQPSSSKGEGGSRDGVGPEANWGKASKFNKGARN